MAKVLFEMDAKSEAVVKAYLDIYQAQARAEVGAKKLADTTKKASEESVGGLQKMGAGITQAAGAYMA